MLVEKNWLPESAYQTLSSVSCTTDQLFEKNTFLHPQDGLSSVHGKKKRPQSCGTHWRGLHTQTSRRPGPQGVRRANAHATIHLQLRFEKYESLPYGPVSHILQATDWQSEAWSIPPHPRGNGLDSLWSVPTPRCHWPVLKLNE